MGTLARLLLHDATATAHINVTQSFNRWLLAMLVCCCTISCNEPLLGTTPHSAKQLHFWTTLSEAFGLRSIALVDTQQTGTNMHNCNSALDSFPEMLSCFLGGSVAPVALLLLSDHVHELLKADVRVMGAGRSLRVVLNGHRPLASIHHASTCSIIQVDVSDLNILGQSCWVHSVVVIL